MGELRRMACACCGARDPEPTGRPRADGVVREILPDWQSVRVVRCRRCRAYYTDPMPLWSDNDLARLYGRRYFQPPSDWWRRRHERQDPQRRLNVIARELGERPLRLLDIGCGAGELLAQAAQRGWDCWGLEPAAAWHENTARRHAQRFWAQRLETARIPERSCDAVFADSVIEHLPEPLTLLRLAARVLRPGGVLFLVAPNADALVNHHRRLAFRTVGSDRSPFAEPLRSPYHLIGLTPRSLPVLAARGGFAVRQLRVLWGSQEWRKGIGWSARRAKSLMLWPSCAAGEWLGAGTVLEAMLVAENRAARPAAGRKRWSA